MKIIFRIIKTMSARNKQVKESKKMRRKDGEKRNGKKNIFFLEFVII